MELVDAWERYARERTPRRESNARGAATWLNWTQYPDHGPDESILGPLRGRTVLELGSGSGCNLAHLATLGADCVGVDIAPSQRERAVARWGHIPGLTFHTAETTDYLIRTDALFDTILSIFGPVWFTEPEQFLPLIRKRLSPGGVLAFSHKPPQDDRQTVTTLREARAVTRWDRSPEEWTSLLASSGFSQPKADIIPPPEGHCGATLLVTAHAEAGRA
ncbi:class I SAM-dependent methyltransferase [Streptomyces albidoflavus]|uniref:class I SAM-dependent methyltransferase n=1 Tax=Streptomyces koyangensis TaxID=188770 RepID=UPI003C2B8136|nr:class I SAM-dependent methyltransferase [Streptomyces albidoflavus]